MAEPVVESNLLQQGRLTPQCARPQRVLMRKRTKPIQQVSMLENGCEPSSGGKLHTMAARSTRSRFPVPRYLKQLPAAATADGRR